MNNLKRENQLLRLENEQLKDEMNTLKTVNADLTYQLMLKGVL